MTAEQSASGQIKSLERIVFAEGFQSILGAGRRKAAGRRLERRDAYLIKSYQKYKRKGDDLFGYVNETTHCANELSLAMISFTVPSICAKGSSSEEL